MGKEHYRGETLIVVKVLILVEGQTEERFIKDIITPHLEKFDVFPIPIIVTTKRVKSGADFKGGISSYTKVKREIQRLLGDTGAKAVTTMLDFYALPDDFPRKKSIININCYGKVKIVEDALVEDVNHKKFIPYLQLHEFEGLLFSLPETIAKPFADITTTEYRRLVNELQNIRKSFKTPEEIDDNPETCPNRRIKKLIPYYRKVLYGTVIARNIGLDTIRQECPHFNQWIEKLEALK
ncbi:MAG: DUF4276 family protein [bacterium]